jgi:hypothetical protein
VGIGVAGRVVAAAAGTAVVAHRDVLDAENYAAWIVVHELAVVADAGTDASRVAWVVAEVVAVVAVAGAIAVVARCLACGVAVGVVETVGSIRKLWTVS